MTDNIGQYRHKLIIEKLTADGNEIGDQIEGWSLFRKVHGAIDSLHGAEKTADAQESTETEMTFKVRWSRALSEMNEQDYRVIYKGEPYDITFIEDIKLRHEVLRITVKRQSEV